MTTSTARSGTRPRRAAPSGYPVLASKITTAALPEWVISRPRLTDRIAVGAAMPLTIVTGPPGAGKTVALASWVAAGTAPGRVAWVTMDDYDNRPGSFWSYLAEALHQAGVAVPGMPAPSRSGAIDHDFLLRLASVLAAQHPPLILVLDDLHLITTPGPLQELASLLRYAKPGLHLIAAARADPLLPLHRYRLAGELTEIRAAELSFTVPEAAQLMAQHGIALAAETLDLITRRIEGWAAGLRLAALSLDNHPDPALFIKNLMVEDNAVTGYLIAEVLDAQPAATRNLMLTTSILNQVNADLACELTGDQQAASTLTALAQSNTFVQPLGRGWYRYHGLLAAVLRLMLRRESPGRVASLHRRAAGWYQQNGLPDEAAAHAAAISDWPLAAQIAVDELAVGDLLQPGGDSPLAGCLRQMPDPPPPDGPPQSLLAAAARQLSGGRDQACADLLASAEMLLDRLPADEEKASRLAAAMIRVAAARRSGDLGAARPAAARAQVLFDQLPDGLRVRHPQTRAQVLSARGTVDLWSGDLAAATSAFRAAAAAADECSQERADCLGHLALIEGLHGHLNRAAELAASAARPQGDDPAGRVIPAAAVALALVHLQRHEPAAWQRQLKEADTALQHHPDRLIGALACLVAARGARALGRGPAAMDLLRRARHGWSPPPWLDHLLDVTESHAHASAGDIQAALDTAGRADVSSALDCGVARARAWLAAGNVQAARQALAGAADGPSDAGTRLEAHLAEALIGYRSGNSAQGRRSLERAVRLGEPEGARLPFSRDWAWIQLALHHDPDLAHTCRWLLPPGQRPSRPKSATAAAPMPAAPVITQDLSDREREVLQLASLMLTTEEIASKLYVSGNTVKTHCRSIYRKLGVTGRGQAVRRARQLRII